MTEPLAPSPFEQEWARCAPWLAAALREGRDPTTLEQVKESVMQGRRQFWSAPDCAIVTGLTGPDLTICNIYLAGGTLASLEHKLPAIEQFAREAGCTQMTILGRLGWQRTFLTRTAGYDTIAMLYTKELERP